MYYILYMDIEKDTVSVQQPNLFLELVPEAYSILRRAMHNSDAKLAVQTAKDVLDYAGQKKEPARNDRPVVFKDAQILALVNVVKEVLE